MKTLIQVIAAGSLLSLAASLPVSADDHAADAAPVTLELTVSGFEATRGMVMVGVFSEEDGWRDNDAVTGAGAPVDGAEITLSIADLPPGEYGLKLYHDVDGNGQLNTNMMGIPTEPFAFSNNARGSFGPASWSDARFTVEAGSTTHHVTIQ